MRKYLLLLLGGFCLQPALAGEVIPSAVTDRLATLVPSAPPTSIRPVAVSGIYEVMYGPELFYMSGDGRYIFRGDILDLEDGSNLSEARRSEARIATIEKLGEDSMVVFAPKETKHTVSVFTDIDCPYCRKFHQEVPALTKAGVRVRYLAFPRAGVGSRGHQQAVSVWCAEDRETAMTDAKAGRDVPQKDCDNPVAKHYQAGRRVGITGTPAIVTDTGRILPGYMPADRLVRLLERGHP